MIERYDNMMGRTMRSVTNTGDELNFVAEDGSEFSFYHSQDCCESVNIEDVCGDLDDLVGSPLVEAECVSCESDSNDGYDSCTWTFYKFATLKGYVTVRWLGTSNGYYSESVSYAETLAS